MLDFFVDDPILLVFVVLGLGAAVGSLRFRSFALGPAAALFVGLAIGAIDEEISGAAGLGLLKELGLVLFTYTVGLASGPTFFAGLKRGGAQAVALTVALVGVLAGMCAVAGEVLGLSAADRAGLFAGSTTNTPSLQAAAEAVSSGDPVVAYSLAYPASVASMLIVIGLLLGKKLRLPARLEPPEPPTRAANLVNWTVRVTRPALPSLAELREVHAEIGFSRVEHDGQVDVAFGDIRLVPGDSVVVVGPREVVQEFCDAVGERSDHHLPLDRSSLDFRRVVVSNRKLAGSRLNELDLGSRFGVTVSRVRRGDEDLVAHDDLALQLGDRVRIVGPTRELGRAAKFFGDSERRLAEVDAFGFALGIAAGLALGTLGVPLPGGAEFELGAGGGTLVVGLVLGVLSRTGPITWQIPQGANLVLRQLGILMFLACAGLGSGTTFADAVVTRHGLKLLAAGIVVSGLYAALIPLAVQAIARRDVIEAAGLFAGIETQPAALAYANERSNGDERINMAYAIVFPAAMIAKILIVQLLV